MKTMDRQGWARLMLAVAALAAAPLAMAQSVSIGGASLKLGAARAATLGAVEAQFRVAPTQRPGQYNIYPEGLPGMNRNTYPPAVGSITFDNNRLVRVTRNLGSFRCNDGQIAIRNLIAAVAQAPNTGRMPAAHTDSTVSGSASTSRVYLSYSDRVIQIVIYQPADQQKQATVDITEQYALTKEGTPPQASTSQ